MIEASERTMVKCKASRDFTHFVPGFGIIHMNPNDPKCAEKSIPKEAVPGLLMHEYVEVISDEDDDASGER